MEVVSNLYTDTLRGFQEGEGRRTGGREERGSGGMDGERREGRGGDMNVCWSAKEKVLVRQNPRKCRVWCMQRIM